MKKTMMQCTGLFMALSLLLSCAALKNGISNIGKPQDEASEKVTIILPAVFMQGYTFESVKASAEANGCTVEQGLEGSILYTMSREQQDLYINGQKAAFDDDVKQILESGKFNEIKDIQHNGDYSEIRLICDKLAAEKSVYFNEALITIGGSAPLYQVYQGKGFDSKSKIIFIDAGTGEEYSVMTTPDDIAWDEINGLIGEGGSELTFNWVSQRKAQEALGKIISDKMIGEYILLPCGDDSFNGEHVWLFEYGLGDKAEFTAEVHYAVGETGQIYARENTSKKFAPLNLGI